MARRLAPFRGRRAIASMVRRDRRIGRGARGRTASSDGSRTDHPAAVNTCIASTPGTDRREQMEAAERSPREANRP